MSFQRLTRVGLLEEAQDGGAPRRNWVVFKITLFLAGVWLRMRTLPLPHGPSPWVRSPSVTQDYPKMQSSGAVSLDPVKSFRTDSFRLLATRRLSLRLKCSADCSSRLPRFGPKDGKLYAHQEHSTQLTEQCKRLMFILIPCLNL